MRPTVGLTMDKMVVIVFDGEPAAYAGSRALKELHWEGSITLYSGSVISKESNGKVQVKHMVNLGQAGSVLGTATCALVGALADEPSAVGVSFGGQVPNLCNAGVSEDFLRDVAKSLRPSKSAVVAEIEEDWITPLDSLMDMLGGIVFRRVRAEVLDAQLEREAVVLHAETKHLRDELSHVVGPAKIKLQVKADEARVRLERAKDQAQRRIDAMMLEADAKVRSLQAQAAGAADYAKANIERRIADIQAECQTRSRRLGRAWQLDFVDR
jgi:uncharacterized membrane protein